MTILKGGQKKFVNNVTTVKQNIKSFVKNLPRYANECQVLTMNRHGANLKELRIRRKFVEKAMNYLLKECPPYETEV